MDTATEIIAAIRSKRLSSEEAVGQVVQRIQHINARLNAVVVPRFEEALEEARQADQAASDQRGPLHGLPVTIKEMYDVAGLPTTAGISKRQASRASRDADPVACWRSAGAIVVGKTNVPQLGIMVDCDNPVYGRTHHPQDIQRSPGGSSGGDAAVIAAGGSPLSLGSDGGGSIRQPAHFCGVAGFKPTGGRYSCVGHWLSANWPADWAAPGPIARRVDDLILGVRAMQPIPQIPTLTPSVPLEVAQFDQLEGVRIGVYEELEVLPAAPAVRRAVREAAAALSDAGAELVPFKLPDPERLWDLYLAIFYAEGMRDVKRQLAGSQVDASIAEILRSTQLPGWTRPLASRIARWLGQPRIAHTIGNLKRPVLRVDEYCGLLQTMYALRHHFVRRLKKEQIVAVLGPAAATPAPKHDEVYANFGLIYTGIFNLLNTPSGVVPWTQVRPEDSTGEVQPASRDCVDRAMARANQQSEGLPIGVQLSGRPWDDGRLLALMRCLEQSSAVGGVEKE